MVKVRTRFWPVRTYWFHRITQVGFPPPVSGFSDVMGMQRSMTEEKWFDRMDEWEANPKQVRRWLPNGKRT
jgi:hypothetical protein